MGDDTPREEGREEDLVHVDGRSIPFRAWEHELMLRAAGWVAITQGAALTYVFGARWMRVQTISEEWPLPTILGVIALGWLCVRSSAAKTALAVAGVAFFALLVTGGEWPGTSPMGSRLERLVPVVAGVSYAVSGVLLLRRWALARDVLLALSCAWLLLVGPGILEALAGTTRQTTPPIVWGSRYQGLTPTRHVDIADIAWVAVTWLLPPAFVLFTALSRAGRSLFGEDAASSRLAPFTTLRQGPPSARGWASFFVTLLTLFGTLYTLEVVGRLIRRSW